jgi:osmoprotectant transport system ATP-binding protein
MKAPAPRVSALAAERVSKRFGAVVALDGVSLEVGRGECLAVIGESGSGKTTLLRCFNRLIVPDDGSILVDGADAATLDPIELRRRTGYVPQDGGLLPHWRIRRNVALVPWLRRPPAA